MATAAAAGLPPPPSPSGTADGSGDHSRRLLELAAERLHERGASKCDFVKVKVRLGTQLEHYYILSRFLLSRMLTVITLPQHKAVRIALDVKKHLVDHDRLDITQEELEDVLFAILRQKGFGDEYVRRYQMVTRFYQQKRPLIILIAGSACTGKSSLAQQLASRLNLPNVLQTDVLYELLRASGTGDLPAEPLWRRWLPPGSSLLGEFQRECATMRRALDGDLCKCIRDGKSIIIEGLHLDPGLFLQEFGDPRGEPVMLQADGLAAGEGRGLGPAPASSEHVAPQGPEDAAATAAEAAGQLLVGLQLADGSAMQPPAAAEAGDCAATPSPPPLQRHASPSPQQEQQATGASRAAAVRRTASFGDAVQRLSYGSWHHQESPWSEPPSGRQLLRPRSANTGRSLDLGQAVFMLQSPDSASGTTSGLGSAREVDSAATPAPVPSPRLAACISLPTVYEDAPGGTLLAAGERSSCSTGGTGSQACAAAAAPDSVGSTPSNAPPALTASGSSSGRTAVVQQTNSGMQAPPLVQQQQQKQQPMAAAAAVAAAASSAPSEPRSHASVAAADAAAAAAAGTGPVFVPIVLAAPDEEYEGMLADWLAHQQSAGSSSWGADGSSGGGTDGGPACDEAESLRRLRQLQAHLRQYAGAGVPVVHMSPADMGRALDSMHSYVLSCISLALN